MFTDTKRSIIAAFAAFTIVFAGLSPIFNEHAVTEANAEVSADTDAHVYIDVLDKTGSIMGDPKTEYYSGETITLQPRLAVSGANTNIKNGYFLVRVPKDQYLNGSPDFVDAAPSTGAVTDQNYTCPEGFYCKKYNYALIQGGTKGAYPFTMRFKNEVTPPGHQITVDAALYDSEGNLVTSTSTASVTITSKAGTNFRMERYWVRPSGTNFALPEGETMTVVPSDKPSQSQKEYKYEIEEIAPTGAPSGAGVYKGPYKYKVVSTLPRDPQGRIVGKHVPTTDWPNWVIDLQAGTATYEGESDGRQVNPRLKWDFAGAPLKVKFTENTTLYANTVSELDKGKPYIEKVMPETSLTFSYYNESSGNFSIDKSVNGSLIYASKKFYQKNAPQKLVGADEDLYKPSHNIKVSYWHREYNQARAKVTEISDEIDRSDDIKYKRKFPSNTKTGNYFYSFTLKSPQEEKPREAGENAVSNVEDIKTALADGYNLIGVDSDGTETVIKENVALEEKVIINDFESKYNKIIARFKEPIILSNSKIQAVVEELLTDTEKQAWADYIEQKVANNNNSSTWKRYYDTAVAKYYESNPQGEVTTDEKSIRDTDDFMVQDQIYPIKLESSGNSSIVYKADPKANEREITLSPRYDASYVLNKFKNVKDTKIVVIIPDGFKYVSTGRLETSEKDFSMAEPEVVENYHNSGKTAVIYHLYNITSTWVVWQPANFKIRVVPEPNARDGQYIFDSYMTYTYADYMRPEGTLVPDQYDIDDDGDTTNKVLKSSNTISLVMPKNVYVNKDVSLDGQNWAQNSPPQDLGQPFYYRLTVSNKYVTAITQITIFDHLPEPGDYKTVPNAEGEYLKRGSTYESSVFTTPLTGALEDLPLNQAGPNTKFAFWYATDTAAKEIDAVKALTWKTKDQITDWSQVKYIKAELKPGQSIAPLEEAPFYLQAKVPADKEMEENKFAWNSAAFSDGGAFIEGNETHISVIKYKLSGTVFEDLSRDGIFDADEKPLSGYKVALVYGETANGHNAGDPVLDDQGQALVTTTNDSGKYEFPVYLRGKYQIKVTKKDTDAFSPLGTRPEGTKVGVNSIETSDANVGTSKVFTISPAVQYPVVDASVYDASKKARDVAIKKVDQGNRAVKGVEFTLTYKSTATGFETVDAPNPATVTGTTDGEGMVTFADVPFGVYTLSETNVPAGYTPAEDQEITVSPAPYTTVESRVHLPYLKVVNTAFSGTVKIKKIDVDNNNAPLAGAVFGAFPCTGPQGEECSTTATDPLFLSEPTDPEGNTMITDITYGKYLVKETQAPKNYVLSDQSHEINIDTDAKVISFVDEPLTNERVKGTIKVKKVDDLGRPVVGATFGIYLKNDRGYFESSPAATVQSDDKGIVTFKNVFAGEYKVKETQAPSGYERTSTEKTVTISTHGQVVDMTTEDTDFYVNRVYKGTVNVRLTDSATRSNIPDSEFGLFKCVPSDDDPCASMEETPAFKASTDTSGNISFANVPYGKYKLKQISTPDTYALPAQTEIDKMVKSSVGSTDINIDYNGRSRSVNVTNDKKVGSITTKVVDGDDNTTVLTSSSVKFNLVKCLPQTDGSCTNDTNTSYNRSNIAVGSDGNLSLTNVPLGTYKLVQVSTDSKYNLGTVTEKIVTLTTDGQAEVVDPFSNLKKRGDITVTKTGTGATPTATPLNGVEFAVYDPSDLQTPICQGTTGTVVDCKTKTVSKEKPDAGKVLFKNLILGKYVVKETQPLENYNPSTETNGKSATVVENTPVQLSFTNEVIKGSVQVVKVDAEDKTTKISGVTFGLYKCTGTAEAVCATTQDTATATQTTGSNGIALFENVVYGDYLLKETAAAEGYTKSAKTIEVHVRQQGNKINLGDFDNARIKGSVQLKKVDAGNAAKALQGVVFELKQGDKVKYTATSNASGMVVFPSVSYGDYTLVEKSTIEGYNLLTQTQLDSQVSTALKGNSTIQIRNVGQLIDLGNITNTIITGDVKVKVVDSGSKKPLAGGEFVVKRGNEVVGKATSNADGEVSFTGLPYGDYTVSQLNPPVGYNGTDKSVDVAIRTQGQSDEHVTDGKWFENTQITGSVQLKKVDAGDAAKALQGVVFELKQGTEVKYTATSAKDGSVTFSNVVYGDYTLVEKSTIEGYNLLTQTELDGQVSKVLAKQDAVISIRTQGQKVNLANIANTIITGGVKVKVVDSGSKKPLAGGEFVVKRGNEVVGKATSNADGEVSFTGLPYGDYTVSQLNPPVGYNGTDKTVDVAIRTQGQSDEHLTDGKWFENTVITGTVKVIKTADYPKGKFLEGVVFELKQGDKVKYTATTDSAGVAKFTDVVYGDYTLVEKSTVEGYVLDTKTSAVKIATQGQEIVFTPVNKISRGSIELVLTDDEEDPLPKQKFMVCPADIDQSLEAEEYAKVCGDWMKSNLKTEGKPVSPEALTTDDNGVVKVSNLPYGNYKVIQIDTPTGYNSGEKTVDVKVLKDGEVITYRDGDQSDLTTVDKLHFVAPRIKTDVTVFNIEVGCKTDSKQDISTLERATEQVKDCKLVPNAKYKLTPVNQDSDDSSDKSPFRQFYTATVDQDGKLVFSDVLYGKYKLSQVTTVPGYEPVSQEFDVEVVDGTAVFLTPIDNYKKILVDPIVVTGYNPLTPEQLQLITSKVIKENDLPSATRVLVDDKGYLTLIYPDGKTQRVEQVSYMRVPVIVKKITSTLANTGITENSLILMLVLALAGVGLVTVTKRKTN